MLFLTNFTLYFKEKHNNSHYNKYYRAEKPPLCKLTKSGILPNFYGANFFAEFLAQKIPFGYDIV